MAPCRPYLFVINSKSTFVWQILISDCYICRSYYRCTFRNTQSCLATKQVQRSDDDPSVFEITYRGKHTCSQGSNSVQPPPSPEKQEQKPNHQNYVPQLQYVEQFSVKSPTNLKVNNEDLKLKEMMAPPFSFHSTTYGCAMGEDNFSALVHENETFLGSFSQSFLSPATSELNYYMNSPCRMNNLAGIHNVQCSESDLTEIISANTSATNSPIPDLDFSLDQVEIDTNFPFDTPGLFP